MAPYFGNDLIFTKIDSMVRDSFKALKSLNLLMWQLIDKFTKTIMPLILWRAILESQSTDSKEVTL